MNAIVSAALARELATLTRVASAAAGALGYGVDLHCVSDVRADLAEVDPTTAQGVVEACIRRLTCPRGGNPDDPDYGLDLRAYCNRGVTALDLRMLGGAIRSELRKDDRVLDADVSVTTEAQSRLRVTVTLDVVDPALEEFSFTFAVTDAAALLETL